MYLHHDGGLQGICHIFLHPARRITAIPIVYGRHKSLEQPRALCLVAVSFLYMSATRDPSTIQIVQGAAGSAHVPVSAPSGSLSSSKDSHADQGQPHARKRGQQATIQAPTKKPCSGTISIRGQQSGVTASPTLQMPFVGDCSQHSMEDSGSEPSCSSSCCRSKVSPLKVSRVLLAGSQEQVPQELRQWLARGAASMQQLQEVFGEPLVGKGLTLHGLPPPAWQLLGLMRS